MTAAALAEALAREPNILGKEEIRAACAALGVGAGSAGRPGDDCAAIPEGDGYALLAAEGFINAFVEADPWFAGWCGVMVNLSDILAMGGRPSAVVDAIWAPDAEAAAPILAGLRAAAAAYGVPVVGGHTNLHTAQRQLAVAIYGRAKALITSFDAAPGDRLLLAVDHRGAWREPFDNWQAAIDAPPERLRADMEILPGLAEEGLVRAGKDVSQGGVVGTALMLAECSGVGFDIDPARIPLPEGVALERWLKAFPSFGFLLSVRPEAAAAVIARFAARDIPCAEIGAAVEGGLVALLDAEGRRHPVRDLRAAPYLGLAEQEPAEQEPATEDPAHA